MKIYFEYLQNIAPPYKIIPNKNYKYQLFTFSDALFSKAVQ